MSSESPFEFYYRQLEQYRANLRHLIVQATSFGGEHAVPLHLKNDLVATRRAIKELKEQLSDNGATVDDLPYELPEGLVLSPPSAPSPTQSEQSFTVSLHFITPNRIVWTSDLGRTTTELGSIVAQDADGVALFGWLCSDRRARDVFDRVRQFATHEGLTINYILRFSVQALSLAVLQWEMLQPQGEQPLLLREGRVDTVVRFIDLDQALPPQRPPRRHLKALLLEPTADAGPASDQARSVIRRALGRSKVPVGLTVQAEQSASLVTLTDTVDTIHQANPDLIHFRGAARRNAGVEGLCFDTEAGQTAWVGRDRLTQLFGRTRLLILEEAGLASRDVSLSGLAAKLVEAGLPAVIAVPLAHTPSMARRFVEVLYSDLLAGRSLQAATARARQTLYIEEESDNWAAPTITIRSRTLEPFFL